MTTPVLFGLAPAFAALLVLCLFISSIGFKRVAYFISIGYAFSVVAMAGVTVLLFHDRWHLVMLLQNAI